jgi:CRISPR-associated endonuclease Csn1
VEFEALWARQAKCNPALFHDAAYKELKDCLLHQRPLKPVKPGRCTLLPEEERARLALPSQQRFRIYQEINNLRPLGEHLQEQSLTLAQRDPLVAELDKKSKLSFIQISKLLKLPGTTQFNLQDAKRTELKGNTTCAILAKKEHFGDGWWRFEEARQDAIVMQLLTEENEAVLVRWLQAETGIDEARAETLANVSLPEGYGSLSAKALARILPALRREVITYDKAVQAAGFEHHSHISHAATGEILPELPYYGEYLQRHVGFGTGEPKDPPEKRFGKIANPTVHIGLNQVRTVVNALIKRYGHPSEVIVEVARELKQS